MGLIRGTWDGEGLSTQAGHQSCCHCLAESRQEEQSPEGSTGERKGGHLQQGALKAFRGEVCSQRCLHTGAWGGSQWLPWVETAR